MAERKRQRQVRCQNQYVYDRLSSQKMSQVYHWLVADQLESESSAKLAVAENEKDPFMRSAALGRKRPLSFRGAMRAAVQKAAALYPMTILVAVNGNRGLRIETKE